MECEVRGWDSQLELGKWGDMITGCGEAKWTIKAVGSRVGNCSRQP